MTIYVCNALSLSMLDRDQQAAKGGLTPDGRLAHPRTPRPISLDEARELLAAAERSGRQIVSAVGHADTAAVLSGLLSRPLQANRVNVKLAIGDLALVGQYVGPRLPEGATSLPEGAVIEWWII